MKAAVIGSGRWGTFITWYIDRLNIPVTLCGRENSANFSELRETRKNEYLELSERVVFSEHLDLVREADFIVISIPAQSLREMAEKLKCLGIKGKILVLCMKGLEESTGKRLTEIIKDEMGSDNEVAIWVGPGHPQEFVLNHPSCMVIDSDNQNVSKKLVQKLSGKLIRIYRGTDLIGNEVGAATKNIMGLAGGMLDGMGYSSLKGALMARGTREISRFIHALGGNPITAYGLSHLGDYEATLFSQYSHNRMYGENFIKGIENTKLAEGVYSLVAVEKMQADLNIDMPICSALYRIIYEEANPEKELTDLFLREIKDEFEDF